MPGVLGIDLGTSYFKLGLFDVQGKLLGLGRVPVNKDTVDGIRCELQTSLFWSLLKKGIAKACQTAGIGTEDIKAVSYSSQANSFILLDKNDKPLTPLILWPDKRAKSVDTKVEKYWQKDIFLQKTGLGVGCTEEFCVPKLRWFQVKEPQIWQRVKRVMTISDYLTYTLTSNLVSDTGTASLLGLLDLPKRKWSGDAIKTAGLEETQLSRLCEPGTLAGKITNNSAELIGLNSGIPLAVGSLDHHAGAVGAGVGKIAQFSESTGTVLASLRFTNNYHPQINTCMGPGLSGYDYYQLAFDGNGAESLQWYQDKYSSNLSLDELGQLAQRVEAGSNGLVAKPMANHYEGLKGFQNILNVHTTGYFVRAIMESTAVSLSQLVKKLCDESVPERIISTGGGAKSKIWLQIKADMLDTEIITSNCEEPACRGAAMFAAVAAGWFDNIEEAGDRWVSLRERFTPEKKIHKVYSQIFTNRFESY
ncbi:MAG: FGGY-family carbohydrate kinase [Planctomycetota bacterium]|jgi:sugar (pentulose or hexulose) kinase